MRLTRKNNIEEMVEDIKIDYVCVGEREVVLSVQKLGQLEDIEEKHNIKFVDDLDKRLIALEIIKEKRVDVARLLVSVDLERYNNFDKRDILVELTQQEFDLLKEVLL